MGDNTTRDPWLEKLGFNSRKAPDFYFSSEFPEKHPYSFYLRELKSSDIGVDAVYFIDNLPVILFKTVQSFKDSNKLKELHKKLWNQSLAPVIILSTPLELRVYSGINKPAHDNEDIDKGGRLLKILSQVSKVEELKEFNVEKFESGDFFREHRSSFDPAQRVDRYLLKQLKNARFSLIEKGLDDTIACSLLGRSIFISYLSDREVLTEEYFKPFKASNFADLLEQKNKELLYNFFDKLKQNFNGDIFPIDNEIDDKKPTFNERKKITKDHVALLSNFLKGTDLETGQLGFWPYDFKYIPIEMISGVYEQFLGGNRKAQKEAGAYYTPRFLADIVIDTAFADKPVNAGLKILDPSCGSGIFLVGMYRRLIESWINQNNNKKPTASVLINILKASIWGIDINAVACHIAAFSLYLAMLNYLKPRDIIELKERGIKLPPLVGSNIVTSDFFNSNCPINKKDFDVIIGNPPWLAATGGSTTFERWTADNAYPIADRGIAQAFAWKASVHLKDNGHITFLLPSSMLYNHSQKYLNFRKHFFEKFSIKKIINMTDLRHFLFSEASGPGIIIHYDNVFSKNSHESIDYLSPKAEPAFLEMELLPLASTDVKTITTALFKKDPRIWKKALWGTERDWRLLDRLEGFQNLSGIMSDRKWYIGRGYERSGPKPQMCPELIGKKEVPRVSPYIISQASLKTLNKEDVLLYRHGTMECYKQPHVLMQRGISSKFNKRVVAAFSSKYVAFNSSIIAISAPKKDQHILRFLSVVLNSSLASYYFFHTSANYGVWHDAVYIEEYDNLPFPMDRLNKYYINAANEFMSELGRPDSYNYELNLSQVKKNLDEIVYKFYDLSEEEIYLVEDTLNIVLPSIQPTPSLRTFPKTLKASTDSDLKEYMRILLDALNSWSNSSSKKVSGRILKSSSPLVVLELVVGGEKTARLEVDNLNDQTISSTLSKIYRLLPKKISRNFYVNRNLRIFDQERLYIIKPKTLRDWTRTAALNEADDILLAIEGNQHFD